MTVIERKILEELALKKLKEEFNLYFSAKQLCAVIMKEYYNLDSRLKIFKNDIYKHLYLRIIKQLNQFLIGMVQDGKIERYNRTQYIKVEI